MNILITGGNGFIARSIICKLSQGGHNVTACLRRPSSLFAAHSKVQTVCMDFNHNLDIKSWEKILINIDIVINCVGVFQTLSTTKMWKIHYHSPKTLVQSCIKAGIKKIIHISALGIDQCPVAYAQSKLAFDRYLESAPVNAIILRPSFVFGQGSFGGSSLFRGLAGFPGLLPLPGQGEQLLQPIHINDLANIVDESLILSGTQRIYVGGAEQISLKNLLITTRAWLGFKPAILLHIPMFLIKTLAKIGNLFPNAPISDAGLKMMEKDNILTTEQSQALLSTISFQPRGFTASLLATPSSVQDRWHARLVLLRPCLRLGIAFIWCISGIVSLLAAQAFSYPLLVKIGMPSTWQPLVLYGSSTLNILLGLATFFNFRLNWIGTIQCLLIAIYTLIISLTIPIFWLHPFGPIAKNIPLLSATLAMMAIKDSR